MSISPNEAEAMLADVDGVVARVKQSRIYQISSGVIMLWGALVVVGDLLALVAGRWTGVSWIVVDAVGLASTLWMLTRAPQRLAVPRRYVEVVVLFIAFGFIWSMAIGGMRPRELDAFWPTLFLFGYALAGLWFGRLFTFIGCGLTILIVAGYYWAGANYNLYLALVNGGGLTLCGYAMRRA